MTQVRIKLNEAELLRAGFPRDAVVALRQIVAVVGSGLEIGEITDVEALVLTTGRNDGKQSNIEQEVMRLGDQVNQIRRDSTAFQQNIQLELESLQQAVRRSDVQQEIERLREQIGMLHQPNLSVIQQNLDELTNYVMGSR